MKQCIANRILVVTNILQGLYFGALLLYHSPLDGHKTRCVYVRDDEDRAVVLFCHAENVARVDHKQLEWYRR